MANPQHVEILKQGAGKWNGWRLQEPHITPDLSNENLSERSLLMFDFSASDLRGTLLNECNLQGVNFSRCNLERANLTAAEVSYAKLSDAQLRQSNAMFANFHGAKLDNANFQGAYVRGAKFHHATLSSASFRHADLSDVIFEGALLLDVEFTKALLNNTKFHRAVISGALLIDVNLSVADGLSEALHIGASSISLDTFSCSGGNISLPFLRGCGVSEEFIQYLPSLVSTPVQFYSCFISYSHEDKAFARLLHDRLQGQGIRCWLDEHQLLPGDDIHDRIDHGIKLWDKVLLCASKPSLTSWWVDGEINRAFQKEAQIMKDRGKKVLALIPLNLDGFLFGSDYQSGKKSEIKSRLAANFVGWEKDHALFDLELEKVIRALRADDAGRETPPTQRL